MQKEKKHAHITEYTLLNASSYALQEIPYPDWEKGLPLDILAQVAGGCDELKTMRGVCKSWQEGYESSVTKIRITKTGPVLPDDRSFQARFPLLAALHLEYCNDSKPALQNLVGLSRLAILSLRPSSRPRHSIASMVRDEDLEPLSRMQLTGLDLSYCCRIGRTALENLVGMPLVSLCLDHCSHLGKNALETLRGLPLTKLDLSYCAKLNNEDLESLEGLPLSDLNLEGWAYLTGEGLNNLGGLPLKKLNLGDCIRLKDDLGYLRALPLSSLRLCGCIFLGGAGLAKLQGLPITDLNLEHCWFLDDPDVLRNLNGLPLESLNLVGVFFAGGVECLFPLVGLPLKKVFLGTNWRDGWDLTNAGLGSLREAIVLGPGPSEW